MDRTSGFSDEFWSSVDFNVYDNKTNLPLYQPKTPPETSETHQWTNSDSDNAIESLPNTLIIDVENIGGCEIYNCFHASDDEQIIDNTISKNYSTGGKRGSADETLIVSSNKCEELSSEPESDSLVMCNSISESEIIGRTRTTNNFDGHVAKVKGCVNSRFSRGSRNCQILSDRSNSFLERKRIFNEKKKNENFNINSVSDLNRPGMNVFRRNYRIGGFKNVSNLRKPKENNQNESKNERIVFTTSEISLPELFADSSVNLIPETELETNDDSFAILDKLGLDDDFIKKEPEISLDVEVAVDKGDDSLKGDTGQNYSDSQSNTFQRQRLKIDKNIFEFSETDFLKYETDCDVDDLLPDLMQNDVVGCCGLFGLTPNSRFNLVSPSYLPLENDKTDGDQLEEMIDGEDDKLNVEESEKKAAAATTSPTSNYGQISDISNDIENHEVTLQLKMNGNVEKNSTENMLTSRLNVKNDFPDGYQLGNGEHAKTPQQSHSQAINYIFALNHHNYTISGPPGTNSKESPPENSQTPPESQIDIELQESTNNSTVNSGTIQTNIGGAWKPTLYRAGDFFIKFQPTFSFWFLVFVFLIRFFICQNLYGREDEGYEAEEFNWKIFFTRVIRKPVHAFNVVGSW